MHVSVLSSQGKLQRYFGVGVATTTCRRIRSCSVERTSIFFSQTHLHELLKIPTTASERLNERHRTGL